jgi:hypothetical protein
VPKKDTAASVLSMLSTQGEQLRPTSSPDAGLEQSDADVHDIAPRETSPGGSGRQARTRSRRAAQTAEVQEAPAAPEPAVENAPRTHRLDQATANNLRAAWLAARLRGEVTISQQEYAGRIIALGLAEEARRLAK